MGQCIRCYYDMSVAQSFRLRWLPSILRSSCLVSRYYTVPRGNQNQGGSICLLNESNSITFSHILEDAKGALTITVALQRFSDRRRVFTISPVLESCLTLENIQYFITKNALFTCGDLPCRP